MKTYRKLSLKSLLLYAISFVGGVFVGLWVKPKPKKTAKFVFVGEGKPHFDKEMWAEPCQEQQEELHTLDDTQPIKVRFTAEEIMPKRYPDEMPRKHGMYHVLSLIHI